MELYKCYRCSALHEWEDLSFCPYCETAVCEREEPEICRCRCADVQRRAMPQVAAAYYTTWDAVNAGAVRFEDVAAVLVSYEQRLASSGLYWGSHFSDGSQVEYSD